MVSAELQALQKRLHHAFANPKLLERALTHRSFCADHNERLEFLGDSVLNLAVSGLLFERLGQLLCHRLVDPAVEVHRHVHARFAHQRNALDNAVKRCATV